MTCGDMTWSDMAYTIEIKGFNELSVRELYELLKLRQDVFVIEQTCIYPDMDGCDFVCYHVLERDETGELAGYLRILPPGQTFDTVAIGRVLVREDARGRGAARSLMTAALQFIRDTLTQRQVKLSAQQYLIGFYESLGFDIISEGYVEDGIPHIDMMLEFDE
ncbi:MAG: GNAT family N-acetyltransferase [Lentihominibacter sp.]